MGCCDVKELKYVKTHAPGQRSVERGKSSLLWRNTLGLSSRNPHCRRWAMTQGGRRLVPMETRAPKPPASPWTTPALPRGKAPGRDSNVADTDRLHLWCFPFKAALEVYLTLPLLCLWRVLGEERRKDTHHCYFPRLYMVYQSGETRLRCSNNL